MKNKKSLKKISWVSIILLFVSFFTNTNISFANASAYVKVSNVSLNKNLISLQVGENEQLTPIISPTNATNKKAIWSSNNSKVATVSENGLVTAKGVGVAIISITTVDGNKKAYSVVNVTTKKYQLHNRPECLMGSALRMKGPPVGIK